MAFKKAIPDYKNVEELESNIKWGIEKVLQHDITTGELYFLIDWSPSICSKRTEKLIKKSKFKKNVYMIYPLNGQFVQIYWSPNWEPLENVETDINILEYRKEFQV